MARQRGSENDVIYAVRQVCGLYGVRVLRMQSRVMSVRGSAGKDRPMFFGQWEDDLGVKHPSGMADLLARPRVTVRGLLGGPGKIIETDIEPPLFDRAIHWLPKITVPLWIETKQDGNRMTADQEAFRYHVEQNGEHFILVRGDVRPLMEWFDAHGVNK